MAVNEFDLILVGAGSSGSVLARRLIDAGKTVAILEAGGYDTNPLIADVASAGALWHGPEDWDYYTTEQEGCNGRRLFLPRGKVMGGSHALNAAIWVRGAKQDFDTWSYLGCPGWSWDDVLPVYKAIEAFDGGASETRGDAGLQDVVENFARNPIQESILQGRSSRASAKTRTTTRAMSRVSRGCSSPCATASGSTRGTRISTRSPITRI